MSGAKELTALRSKRAKRSNTNGNFIINSSDESDNPDDPDYREPEELMEVVSPNTESDTDDDISGECHSNNLIRETVNPNPQRATRNAFQVMKQAAASASGTVTLSKKSKPSSTIPHAVELLASKSTPTPSTSATLVDSNETDNTDPKEFPQNWKFLEKYFKYVKSYSTKKGYTYCGKCLKPGCGKEIKGDKSSYANFKRHYQKIHNETISTTEDSSGTPILKTRSSKKTDQMTLRESLEPISNQSQMTKKTSQAIYKNYHPFSMAEEDEFVHLLLSCLISNVEDKVIVVPDRKDVVKQMEKDYERHEKLLKDTLKEVEYVSVTADVWKASKHAFLGMTVHWINQDLTRHSAVLALQRMQFEITYLELGTVMNDILKKYEILEKTVMITTDNGSNFIKSFRVYADNGSNYNFVNIDEETDDDNYEFVEVFPMMEDDESAIYLPPNHRCASHTLNLLMQSDADKFNDCTQRKILKIDGKFEFQNVAGVYVSAKARAFELCKALWKAQNKTTKIADYIHKVLGKYLPVPNDTRWNSFYDAVKVIADEKNEEKILKIGQKLSVFFEARDLAFLREYCSIMKPCADGLDILQGENKMYFGAFLPTIYYIKAKLAELQKAPLVYCAGFVKFLSTSLEERFKNYWTKEEYLLASALHPHFKNISKWIRNEEVLKIAENAIKNLLESCNQHSTENVPSHVSSSADKDKINDVARFFDIELSDSSAPNIDCGYKNFLADRCSLAVMSSYPCLKKWFVQYNTALPSSAAVERIFNKAGDILGKRKHNITDTHFEQRLKLKIGIKKSI